MNAKSRIIKFYLIFFFCFFLVIILSCNKDEEDQGTPPTIPPASTMVMDYGNLTNNSLYKVSSNINWTYARTTVAFWNTVLTSILVVPVQSFLRAFYYIPTKQNDGSWLWTYQLQYGAALYTAKLYGKVVGSEVQWNMYISKTGAGGYTDFRWFYGNNNLSLTSGTWQLNKPPALTGGTEVLFLDIDWTRNTSDSTGTVKYTDVAVGDTMYNSFILFGYTNDSDYNRYYDVFNSSVSKTTNIKWKYPTYEGRVKDPSYFGDANWHCWDATLSDVVCGATKQ